jgi:MarR family transcriptional regulator, transcriptional regulator for hemolysin
MKPSDTPIGLQLAMTSKAVARAFGAALAEAGGSLSTWLVLASLRDGDPSTQVDLARAVGVEGPTLTRHLDTLEAAGLVERHRDTGDRRAVRVQLTDAGVQLHGVLLKTAMAFNERLAAGLTDAELKRIGDGLLRLAENVRD